MKLYARQVPPEYQESPIYMLRDCWENNDIWEGISVDGNDRMYGRKTPEYETVRNYIEEAGSEIDDIADKSWRSAYETATEAIMAFFPSKHKEKYSSKD